MNITASPHYPDPISYAATLETGAKIPESQICGSDSYLGDNDVNAMTLLLLKVQTWFHLLNNLS